MIRYHILKAAAFIVEILGRLFVFNVFKPRARRLARQVPYCVGDPRKQALEIVVPPSGEGPFPVIVYIHGGGFMCMDKKSYTRIAHCYAASGCVVFNINYRLAPACRYEEQLRDVASAVRWAYENAASYAGDNTKIFLAGDSAGAFLAAWYAAACDKPSMLEGLSVCPLVPRECLAGLLLYYGVFDWESALASRFPFNAFIRVIAESFFGEGRALCESRSRATAPMLHAGENFPPTLIVCGGIDPVRPQSIAFADRLVALGVRCETLLLDAWRHPFSTHAFLNVWFLGCARRAMRRSCEFVNRVIQAGVEPEPELEPGPEANEVGIEHELESECGELMETP